MDTIAARIQQALDQKGWKQADLVKATGIGKASISTYLAGEYEPKQKIYAEENVGDEGAVYVVEGPKKFLKNFCKTP